MFCPEKSTCCFVETSQVLRTKGMLGNNDVWTS